MNMTTCPECGTRLSEITRTCPGCACPVAGAYAAVAALVYGEKWGFRSRRIRFQSFLASTLLLEGLVLLAQYLVVGQSIGLYLGLFGVESGLLWLTAIRLYTWWLKA